MDPNTPTTGAGEALPAVSVPAPKNDIEAAALAAATPPAKVEPTPADEAAAGEEKKKNRTRDYINRINRENAELRQRAAELESRQFQSPRNAQIPPLQRASQDLGPTLEEYGYDPVAHQAARDRWLIDQANKQFQEAATQRQQQEQQTRLLTTYNQRAASFAEQHPDFQEAVGSIDPQFLPDELQNAILENELGPQIAYHLANDEEALWQLASIRADLLPAAIKRLASRLSAAPAPQASPAAPIAPTQPKPITQAPRPVPTVSGRSPTETPPEKLTDDEWWAREKERRRKR